MFAEIAVRMSGNAGVSDKTEPDRPCLEGSDVQVRRSYVSHFVFAYQVEKVPGCGLTIVIRTDGCSVCRRKACGFRFVDANTSSSVLLLTGNWLLRAA